jgi:hypothetical protein
MDLIKNIDAFEPLSDQEVQKVKFSDKEEMIFSFNCTFLPQLIESTKGDYSILIHNGKKYSSYKLLYFDTPKNRFYLDAHNGKRNRFVVRFRQCIESNITYFEVKYINKKGRKKKKKIEVDEIKTTLGEEEIALLKKVMPKKKARKLTPRITCEFKRFVLINKQNKHKVTVDSDMKFTNNSSEIHYSDITTATILQERYDRSSKINAVLRESGIRQGQIGNYALGMSIFGDQKTNIYKEKEYRINKLIENDD